MNKFVLYILIFIFILLSFFTPIYSQSDFIDNAAFGELKYYNESVYLNISIPSYNTYYNITGLSCTSNNFNVNCNNSRLEIIDSGYYFVIGSFSFQGGSNTEYEYELFINNNDALDCEIHRGMGANGDVGASTLSCLQYLNKYDVLSIQIKDITNPSQNIKIHSLNFNIIKIIGGGI